MRRFPALRRVLVIVLVVMSTLRFASAQDGIVLTVMVPSGYGTGLEESLARYTQEHPEITIQTVDLPAETLSVFDRLDDPEAYLDTMASLAGQADLLLVDQYTFGIEATRTHYFRDLQPLISLDELLQEVISPAMWQAFRWDNGTWAVPVYAGPLSLIYSTDAFDQQGLPYPDGAWTSEDYLNVVRDLSTGDTPAMFISELDLPLWLRSLLGEDFVRDEVGVAAPNLTAPELVALLAAWAEVAQEDALTTLPSSDTALRIDRGFDLPAGFVRAPLPGGEFGLYAFGLAVSSGSAHPEDAFRLAGFLASSPEFVTGQSFAFPADRTLAQPQVEGEDWGTALENALSPAIFDLYVAQAWRDVGSDDGLDAAVALENAQTHAEQTLALAAERQSETIIVVVPPETSPVVPGEIVLNFGIVTSVTEFPSQRQWQAVVEEFLEET